MLFVGPQVGQTGEIPITPGLRIGAPANVIQECVRSRRIWVGGIKPGDTATQITSDSRYFDEEPMWSVDGGHILFCRTETQAEGNPARAIWLMRNDGSEVRKVAQLAADEQLPFSDFYGYTDWRSRFAWMR